jgi:hypothetical protein
MITAPMTPRGRLRHGAQAAAMLLRSDTVSKEGNAAASSITEALDLTS